MNVLIDGEIVLDGTVGAMGLFGGQSFTATDVSSALSKKGRAAPIKVRINSGGGLAAEGVAIFNRLRAHSGKVTVTIDGIAASAASVIAMAGDEIIMARGSTMMIHDPSSFTMGTSDDHSKSIEMLEAVAESMVQIYADRTGRNVSEIREEMKSEIWMTADEAVAKGYADKVEKVGIGHNSNFKVAAFDYRLYANAPERLSAMAQANAWKLDPGAFKERARAADITAACQMTGKPALAPEFIAKGTSLGEVLAILQRQKASEVVVELHNRPAPAVSAAASWEKIFKQVEEANALTIWK